MPLISVIVPVYNAEKFLKGCVNSILLQTFEDFELLLVDDGSIDSSSALCDMYSLQDLRVRVFHKKNGGVTSARRLGVENAKGRFVTFVDSDDELYPFSLSTLVSKIDDSIDIIVSDIPIQSVMIGDDFIKHTLLWKVQASVWGRLYRRTLFDETSFDVPRELIVGEDAFMNIRVGMNARFVKTINERVYCYNRNENSITATRKFSLEYEVFYMEEITRSLGDRVADFYNELCDLKLGAFENMIVCRIPVPYDCAWVKELQQWGKSRKLSFRRWVVLNIEHNILSKYILAVEKRIKLLFHSNKRT